MCKSEFGGGNIVVEHSKTDLFDIDKPYCGLILCKNISSMIQDSVKPK